MARRARARQRGRTTDRTAEYVGMALALVVLWAVAKSQQRRYDRELERALGAVSPREVIG